MDQTVPIEPRARDPLMIFSPDPENTQELRAAFARFATGVTVVTCTSDNGPVAITANSFSSISLEPPLVMWAAARRSRRFPAFAEARHYAIHVLRAEQKSLCELFARNGFGLADVAHEVNDHGVPLIDGCLARFECRQTAMHDAGDHAIILGQVERAELRSGDALAFFGGQFVNVPHP
jgi:flavin reductase (DIM6/NTAB) family NADH-FMN oxidoreductase RutF